MKLSACLVLFASQPAFVGVAHAADHANGIGPFRVGPGVSFQSKIPVLLARGVRTGGIQSAYVTVAIEEHGLGILTDGSVIGWGLNNFGQATPGLLTGAVEIASGQRHSYALLADGSLVGFGANQFFQTSTPSELGPVRRISAGADHTVAVLENGSLAAWGCENCPFDFGLTDFPAGLSDVVAVDAEGATTVWLHSDGTVGALEPRNDPNFGFNVECDQGDVPVGLTDIVDIAAGTFHGLALTSSGEVVAWGAACEDSDFGQAEPPVALADVIDIAAGAQHSVALRADGLVVCWGNNIDFQCRVPPSLPRDVVGVNADGQTTTAIFSDGSIIVWGDRGTGQGQFPPGAAFRLPGDLSCPADLAEPIGTLNFFDIAAFIGSFNDGEASADLAEPFGELNFFDISAYIGFYNAGCP